MNTPPTDAIRVPAPELRSFVAALMQRAGLAGDKADLLAELLVANDLRGTFSHGTRQAATYAGLIAEGRLNGAPQVRLEREEEVTALFDGDGGLGYFPALAAARWVIAPAKRHGIAVAATRNHGHFGAAGIYSRVVVAADLIAYVTSGHQLALAPDHSVLEAAGGSPMSFGVPAGEQPPLLLDFGAMHDLYPGSPYGPAIFALAPGLVLRSMGLGMVCQALGGFLAGVPVEEARARKAFAGANQGSLIIALDPARFIAIETLKAELDRYHELVHQLQPLSPATPAVLPGTLERQREQEYGTEGIPVGRSHRQALAAAAMRFGLQPPFPASAS
jgi:LDH2 family malate/lactate/ureidoglycolate dehydrogenase